MYSNYYDTLLEWLSSAEWHFLLTLTSSKNMDKYWYQSKLEKIRKTLMERHRIHIEFAASIELTKNGINHCHALIRVIGGSPIQGIKGDRVLVPNDWHQRFNSKNPHSMINFVHTVAGTGIKGIKAQTSDEALKQLRSCYYTLQDWMRLFYQCNYGSIADVQAVRSQEQVVSYAMKYATKALKYQSHDWFISSRVVPSQG